MGLLPDIEALVCGDDPFSRPKPAPNNALYLSNLFNCPPEKMAVVGDTPSDTGMGKAAGLGTVIGWQFVLSTIFSFGAFFCWPFLGIKLVLMSIDFTFFFTLR